MKISIVCPTLGRSHLLGPLAMNVHQTTTTYTLLFVVDETDAESRAAIASLGNARMLVHDGTYPQKINAGVAATDDPFVALVNDDVAFHSGWYEAASAAFREGVDVVGPSDTTPATENGDHATMPLVRRSYTADPGAAWGAKPSVMHEGYHHAYSETELWQLAVDRGVARFVPECVIEHRHPDWGTAGIDETYRRGAYKEGSWEQDEALFGERRQQWRS